MTVLAKILYILLLTVHVVAPPKGMTETSEELDARLRSIAVDADVAAKGSASDALLILAVSEHEAGLAVDVDKGPCRPGTCDGGHAACMMQIHGGSEERNKQLFADRQDCFRSGLKALHNSMATCSWLPAQWQFAAYASGSCISDSGRKGSSELFAFWQRWLTKFAQQKAANDNAKAPAATGTDD